MPIEITMPKLSDTMTEGTLVKWNKKEGDKVKPGDLIAEVETDKATQELEVFDAGTIAKIVVPEGGKTPVGGVIVVLAKPDEDPAKVKAESKATAAAPAASAGKASAAPAAKPMTQPAAAPAPTAAPQPAAAAPAEPEEDARSRNGKLRVSPLARKIAEEKGVDLNSVTGTGPAGRIIKKDVLAAAERPAQPGAAPGAPAARATAPTLPAAKLEDKTIPLTGIRQTIARRLLESKQTIPHFYVSIDVQMDQLLSLRKQANEQIAPDKLTVTDFIVRAVAVALTRLPQVNASFTEQAILQHGSVDLGIAVSIEDGLLVPVLRAAHTKGVRQISAEVRQLAEQARTRKLKAQDMTGSTFTISNMGMYGIKDFLAIINPPESAILAVGGTEWRPIVVEEGGARTIKPAQMMTISLSADHRVVDGALGARFIAELKSILEHPLTMLI